MISPSGTIRNKIEKQKPLQILLVIAITLLATALRFYKLGEWSFWIEEHHSLRHTANLTSLASIIQSTRPLYYLMSKPFLNYWGINEWTARFLPALLGITTVPILYLWVKRLFGFYAAVLSSLLIAVAPWHIFWSQNNRFYSLLLLLFMVALFNFYWGLEKDRSRYIIFSFVTLGLAAISHAIAALLIPLFILYIILLKILPFEKPPGLRFKNIWPFVVLPVVGYLIFEVILVFFLKKDPFIYQLYLLFFNDATASYIGYEEPYIMITAVVYRIGTPLAFFSIPGTLYLLKKRERKGLILALGAYLPLITFAILTLVASTAARYVFMALPCWIILGSVGLIEFFRHLRSDKRTLLWLLGIPLILVRDPAVKDIIYYFRHETAFAILLALGILLTIICGIGIYKYQKLRNAVATLSIFAAFSTILLHAFVSDGLYYAYQGGHRDNWQAAANLIQQQKAPSDIVISAVPPIVTYYLGENTQEMAEFDWSSITERNQVIWFVEDFGLEQSRIANTPFEQWVNSQNCHTAGDWSQYVSGQLWKMKVIRCILAE